MLWRSRCTNAPGLPIGRPEAWTENSRRDCFVGPRRRGAEPGVLVALVNGWAQLIACAGQMTAHGIDRQPLYARHLAIGLAFDADVEHRRALLCMTVLSVRH